MDDPFSHSVLGSGVFYRDALAALDWLETAFGFSRSMVVTDTEGRLVHAEMRFGDGYIIVDSEWSDIVASPLSVGGKNTQAMYVRLAGDIETHCRRADAAGAKIVQAPTGQFYGERTYRALDPEGHLWTFSQTIASVPREQAETLSGMTIDGWHYPAG